MESGRWWQKGSRPSQAKKALTARERRQQLLTQLVTAEPDDVSVITICSQMGGVGKTLISAYLATLAARHRTNDRVLAIDINPDAGRLRARMGVEGGLSLRQTYENRSTLTTYAAVRRCFSYTPAGVAVIGSDPNPDRDEGFGDSEYRETIATLSILANTFVNDCGTNLLHPLTRGAMARTDQLIYVTDCSEDGLELTRDAFDTFEVKGYGEQVRSGVLVLTNLTPGSPVERFQEAFQSRCRQVVSVRHNEFLARRTPVDVEALDLSDAAALNDLLEVTASVFTGLAGKAGTQRSRWRDEDYPVSMTTKDPSLHQVALDPADGGPPRQLVVPLIGADMRSGHHKDCPCMRRYGRRRRPYRFRWPRFVVPLALAAGVGLPLAMLNTAASARTQTINPPTAVPLPARHPAAPPTPRAANLLGRQGSTSAAPSLSPAGTPLRTIIGQTVPTTMTRPRNPSHPTAPPADAPTAQRRATAPRGKPLSNLPATYRTAATGIRSNTATQTTAVPITRSNTATQTTAVPIIRSNTATQTTSVSITQSNTATQTTSVSITQSNGLGQSTSVVVVPSR